jgi:uncharacterized damage-inducible protein DinB
MAHSEAWLRGPVDGVPDLLQPVAHALIQARDEVEQAVESFPDDLLWQRPANVASVGFHLLHLSGVVDRLLTYARGEQLSPAQIQSLRDETQASPHTTAHDLTAAFRAQVDRALDQLRTTDVRTLVDARAVGRGRLPSTAIGLLVHAAEHAQRHVGQLLVTARVQLSDR